MDRGRRQVRDVNRSRFRGVREEGEGVPSGGGRCTEHGAAPTEQPEAKSACEERIGPFEKNSSNPGQGPPFRGTTLNHASKIRGLLATGRLSVEVQGKENVRSPVDCPRVSASNTVVPPPPPPPHREVISFGLSKIDW